MLIQDTFHMNVPVIYQVMSLLLLCDKKSQNSQNKYKCWNFADLVVYKYIMNKCNK